MSSTTAGLSLSLSLFLYLADGRPQTEAAPDGQGGDFCARREIDSRPASEPAASTTTLNRSLNRWATFCAQNAPTGTECEKCDCRCCSLLFARSLLIDGARASEGEEEAGKKVASRRTRSAISPPKVVDGRQESARERERERGRETLSPNVWRHSSLGRLMNYLLARCTRGALERAESLQASASLSPSPIGTH